MYCFIEAKQMAEKQMNEAMGMAQSKCVLQQAEKTPYIGSNTSKLQMYPRLQMHPRLQTLPKSANNPQDEKYPQPNLDYSEDAKTSHDQLYLVKQRKLHSYNQLS